MLVATIHFFIMSQKMAVIMSSVNVMGSPIPNVEIIVLFSEGMTIADIDIMYAIVVIALMM